MISNEYALSGGSLRNSVPRSAPRGTKKSAQRAKSITTTGMIGISFVGTPAHQTPHRNSFGSLGTVMRIMLKKATVPKSMKGAGTELRAPSTFGRGRECIGHAQQGRTCEPARNTLGTCAGYVLGRRGSASLVRSGRAEQLIRMCNSPQSFKAVRDAQRSARQT